MLLRFNLICCAFNSIQLEIRKFFRMEIGANSVFYFLCEPFLFTSIFSLFLLLAVSVMDFYASFQSLLFSVRP